MGGGPSPSVLREDDFSVPLPEVTREGSIPMPNGSRIHPVQYHIFMSRTARAYHRFQRALQNNQGSKLGIVRAADEQLAELIDDLPPHLQPDMKSGVDSELETVHPWIRWQKVEFTLVLLYHRLCLYRVLQAEWTRSPEEFASPRAVCLITARDIIWISQNWELPHSERRQW
jgi:hypothetical protein